jgi:uncharacterized protein YfdQ (DUF2303 family)
VTNLRSDAEDIIAVARQATIPTELAPGKIYLAVGADGGQKVVSTEQYGEHPLHKQAGRTVRDVRSLLTYLDKHAVDGETEVYADPKGSTIVAVLDAHAAQGLHAGRESHTVTLALQHSEPWKRWTEFDGKEMPQLMFANFIEDNLADIVQPTPADMLEIAQSLQGSVSVDWKSSQRLGNGQTKLQFEENVEARAGQKGDIEIPSEFLIALRPYIGGEVYGVKVRFRYRISAGNVLFTYLLDRPFAVLEEAFADMVNILQLGIEPETVVIREGGDGVKGLELALPAVPGFTPVLVGKP